MKRLLWLFTMLICFSFAGFSNTTIDLTKNSNKDKELVSYSDVVKAEALFTSTDFKVVVSNVSELQVPIFLKDAKKYSTRSIYSMQDSAAKADIDICIRDKIRII